MKTFYLTNIPAPYREKSHEIIFKMLKKSYSVIYCSKIEPNRKWSFLLGKYKKTFLQSVRINFAGRYVYLWSNVLSILKKEKPKIIIISGFSGPMIVSFIWAKFSKCKIIASSDATIMSENLQKLTFIHKILRRVLYPRMDAYVGVGKKTIKLFQYYRANKKKCFISPFAIDNKKFKKSYKKINSRKYDIILCGRFIQDKLFDFSLNVIEKLFKRKKKLKIKLVGDGPLKNYILKRLEDIGVNYKYSGFVQQEKLIKEYTSAKIFLFPTKTDAWGIVANESCASGTPVITCNEAGAANELIKNNYNGHILKLNTNLWAKKIIKLLNNKRAMNIMSKNALKSVEKYDSMTAATGIVKAVKFVCK